MRRSGNADSGDQNKSAVDEQSNATAPVSSTRVTLSREGLQKAAAEATDIPDPVRQPSEATQSSEEVQKQAESRLAENRQQENRDAMNKQDAPSFAQTGSNVYRAALAA